MSNVIEVTGSLSQWVNSTERRLVVIDFFATWCGPCKMMHPIFDQLSMKYPHVVFLRVDGDKNRSLSAEYGISGFPTFIFVFHGGEVDRLVGANPSGLEEKILQYAQSAQTFKGTGMTLGGTSSSTPESAREMRLKKFKDVKMCGTEATSKVSKLMNKLSQDASDSDENEIVEPSNNESDAALRDTLTSMGFSSTNIDITLRECKSRDIADVVTYITSLPETNSTEHTEHTESTEPAAPKVVCDGNQCRLVTEEPPKKSFEERMKEMKEMIKEKKMEKEKQQKEEERIREKERISHGKEMQEKREEFERMQRQREIEKENREKREAEEEKKRQLELWRKEHGLPAEVKEVKQKTPEEKIRLLAESVAVQRMDNVGPIALKTIVAMLENCSKPDPKYRQVKKENVALKKRVLSVPGALPLLLNAGFEDAGEVYLMKEYNVEKVSLVLNTIKKLLYYCLLNKYSYLARILIFE